MRWQETLKRYWLRRLGWHATITIDALPKAGPLAAAAEAVSATSPAGMSPPGLTSPGSSAPESSHRHTPDRPLAAGWYMVAVEPADGMLGHDLALQCQNGPTAHLLIDILQSRKRLIHLREKTLWLDLSLDGPWTAAAGTRITLSRVGRRFAADRMRRKLHNLVECQAPQAQLAIAEFARLDASSAIAFAPRAATLYPCYQAVVERHVRPYNHQRWRALQQPPALPDADQGMAHPVRIAVLTTCATTRAAIRDTLQSLSPKLAACWTVLPGIPPSLNAIKADYIMLAYGQLSVAGDALFLFQQAIESQPDVTLLYSDHDYLDEQGLHTPVFKPPWNPELLYAGNYVGPLFIVKRDDTRFIDALAGQPLDQPEFAYRLLLAASTHLRIDQVARLPAFLYSISHSRKPAPPASGVFDAPADAHTLSHHLDKHSIQAAVVDNPATGTLRVRYHLPSTPPKVDIIIPTRDQLPLLQRCVDSILQMTDYPEFVITIVDNDSKEPATRAWLQSQVSLPDSPVQVLPSPGAFNYAAINNNAVEHSVADVVVLLNNDTEVHTRNWLRELVTQAIQARTGCVGCLLLYSDGRVQHAGTMVGGTGVAGHAYRFFPGEAGGYRQRMQIAHNVSAVTAACLAIRRELYLEVGGLDAQALPVAFNDVDLCLKTEAAGFATVYTPHAMLIHHESVSRGTDNAPDKAARFAGEVRHMQTRWASALAHDRAWHPAFALDHERWAITPWCLPD